MYCVNCGNLLNENDDACKKCGHPVKNKQNTNNQEVVRHHNVQQEEKVSALIVSIISLFFFGLILGIIGLVLSAQPNQKYRVASKIISIIGIVGWALIVFIPLFMTAQ